MLAATVRSGLVESIHPWSAVAVDRDGSVLESFGAIDETFFYRSAIKPFQAAVSVEAGVSLPPEYLAVASASHTATPVHVAIVSRILADGGFDESHLGCPPSRPYSPAARDRLAAVGIFRSRVFHNCSGKHAAFLRACGESGWPVDSYLSPEHPLQQRVIDLVAETTGVPVEPVGIDGCGAPTLRGSLRGLATGFARLSVDVRFSEVATAMHRYPALSGGNERVDGRLAMWWDGPAKCGAEGLMSAGRHGVGIAVKSHEGSIPVACMGLIEVARRMGMLSDAALTALDKVHTPDVLGAGGPVGSMVADLSMIDATTVTGPQ